MYTLPFKGVMDDIHCSREVEEGQVITQTSPVQKHDAIIQRARSSKSKGDITSHFAKNKDIKNKHADHRGYQHW